MKKIRVLLVEDNRLLREGTTSLLNEQEDIKAVATLGNRSALEKARKLTPDVILLDLGLKSHNSMKVLETLKKQYPRAEIIVMDLLPAHSDAVEFVKAGVAGFVPRDATLDDFLTTIRSVIKGVKILPATMADSLFSQIVEGAIQGGRVDRVVDAVKLSERELSVITLMAEGKSIAETSVGLDVATFTVKNHVRNILDKFALHTRLEQATAVRTKRFKLKKAVVRDRTKRE